MKNQIHFTDRNTLFFMQGRVTTMVKDLCAMSDEYSLMTKEALVIAEVADRMNAVLVALKVVQGDNLP